MTEPEQIHKQRSKGVYLLPNLFTTAGLFAGFYAIIAAVDGHFENAAIAIFVALIMDGMDGRVARMTHTESDFGAEYDSLADMVSFGLAPALVIHQWALTSWGKIGWLGAFVFAACAALRLARFNTQVGAADKRFFQGLASPAAASLVAGFVWLGVDVGWEGTDKRLIAIIVSIGAGILMVTNIRYHSFKQFDLRGKVPFMVIVALMLAFALIYLHPPVVLFAGFFIYAVSGPVMALLKLKKNSKKQDKPSKAA